MKSSKKIMLVAAVLLLAAALFVGAGAAEATDVGENQLATAVSEADEDATLKLTGPQALTEPLVVDKSITIDLNGQTISKNTTTWSDPNNEDALIVVYRVESGAGLTINDSSQSKSGIIDGRSPLWAAIGVTSAYDANNTSASTMPAKLTVNGGTIYGEYYAIVGNGTNKPGQSTDRSNTVIIITGGKFISTSTDCGLAIYHPQKGTLTISGGEFTGYDSAIEIRSGTLNITGGTFTSTAPTYSCTANGDGTTTIGAAIAIAQHTTKKDIAVTITNGTFTGVKAVSESNPQANDPAPRVNLSLTGGTYVGDIQVQDTGGTININETACTIIGSIIKGGASEVTFEMPFGYTVVIPALFDFGSNKTLKSEVSVNITVPDSSKTVYITVNGGGESGRLLKKNETDLGIAYIITKEEDGTADLGTDVTEVSGNIAGEYPTPLWFKIDTLPGQAGTYKDTLTFTTSLEPPVTS